MFEFFEYCPVSVFQCCDRDFDLYNYFADDYEYRFPEEHQRLVKASDGRYHFDQDGYNPEIQYRDFRILIADCDRLFIASAIYQSAWLADIPYSLSSAEIFNEAQRFVDSWYYSQPSPGQLLIPELALN